MTSTETQATIHPEREGAIHMLLAYSCTALGTIGLLTVYTAALALDGSLWLSGGCLVAFAAGIVFAHAARELGPSRRARIIATVALVLDAVLLLAAGLTVLLVYTISQMEFSF